MKNIFLNFLSVVIISSILWACANPGIPTGGPKDEDPPVVVRTVPENYSGNFDEKRVSIYFDEFVQLKEVRDKFIMSPPQKRMPNVRLKGKFVVVELRDTVRENTTYTMDFADAIVDNNEGNPLGDFQFVFSTGEQLDSLMIRGYVEDAFNQQPIENAFVMIYENAHDSIPLSQVPDFIARTDTAGFFSLNNIRAQTYRILALIDNNRDYIFNSPAEPVAFSDVLITPKARYVESMDTISADSVMLRGYTVFSPADIRLRMFQEEDNQLHLTKYDRPRREKLEFHFNRKRTDSLLIDLLEIEEGENWFVLERTRGNDTLSYWITDSLIYRRDSLMAELQYFKTDSLGALVNFRDTVKLNFRPKKEAKLSKKRKQKISPSKDSSENSQDSVKTDSLSEKEVNLSIEQKRKISFPNDSLVDARDSVKLNFQSEKEERTSKRQKKKTQPQTPTFKMQAKIPPTMDLNKNFSLIFEEPVKLFQKELIHLYLLEDTLKIKQEFDIQKDSLESRTWHVSHKWEPEASYEFQVDSAAFVSVYELANNTLKRKFTVQEREFYGKIILNLNNVKAPLIVELLKDGAKQQVVQRQKVYTSQNVEFSYLYPDTYRVKIIVDENDNDKWDTGNYLQHLQPEQVFYFTNPLKVRSNWDIEERWDLP